MSKKKLTNKEKLIADIKYLIKYEKMPGIHTYSQCDCERRHTRRGRCILCLEEDLEAVMNEK